MSASITLRGEVLVLLPDKAAFWPRRSTLLVADPHWGKPAAFLAAGVAVPQDSTAADLARLTTLLEATAAVRVVVLGDLFHAKAAKAPHVLDAVAGWRAGHPDLEVVVVRGNHDRHAGDPPPGWCFRCEGEPVADPPFAFRHYPEPTAGLYTLAGHVHPSVVLRGSGRQRLRLPCFHFAAAVGTLPAFGGFTGTADVAPAAGDRVFVAADGEVVEVG